MSNGTYNTILGRIAVATPQSPIAVFHRSTFDNFKHDLPLDVEQPMLDAVFADTIDTMRMIDMKDRRLIGVFHSGMDKQEVKNRLRAAMGVEDVKLTDLQSQTYRQLCQRGAANVYELSTEVGCSDNGTRSALTRLTNLGLAVKSDVCGFWMIPGYTGEIKKNTLKQRMIDKMRSIKIFKVNDLYQLGKNKTIRTTINNLKNEGLVRSIGDNNWEWVG